MILKLKQLSPIKFMSSFFSGHLVYIYIHTGCPEKKRTLIWSVITASDFKIHTFTSNKVHLISPYMHIHTRSLPIIIKRLYNITYLDSNWVSEEKNHMIFQDKIIYSRIYTTRVEFYGVRYRATYLHFLHVPAHRKTMFVHCFLKKAYVCSLFLEKSLCLFTVCSKKPMFVHCLLKKILCFFHCLLKNSPCLFTVC